MTNTINPSCVDTSSLAPLPASAELDFSEASKSLHNRELPLVRRFDALFTLRSIGSEAAALEVCACLERERTLDPGAALLNHELAYCLGQIRQPAANPTLLRVLVDPQEDPMVRHEAGEALGAIGEPAVLNALDKFSFDPVVEVAETCQLAAARIRWSLSNCPTNSDLANNSITDFISSSTSRNACSASSIDNISSISNASTKDSTHEKSNTQSTLTSTDTSKQVFLPMPSPYFSVDPAPPCELSVPEHALEKQLSTGFSIEDCKSPAFLAALEVLVDQLGARALDHHVPLFERYRALFALRNLSGSEQLVGRSIAERAVLALARALHATDSALFRHEVAYILGQVQSPVSLEALQTRLADKDENCMVRHECAEAIGSIGTDECYTILGAYREDPVRVVRESCQVALSIADEERREFQSHK